MNVRINLMQKTDNLKNLDDLEFLFKNENHLFSDKIVKLKSAPREFNVEPYQSYKNRRTNSSSFQYNKQLYYKDQKYNYNKNPVNFEHENKVFNHRHNYQHNHMNNSPPRLQKTVSKSKTWKVHSNIVQKEYYIIASLNPKNLIIFIIYKTKLYQITQNSIGC